MGMGPVGVHGWSRKCCVTLGVHCFELPQISQTCGTISVVIKGY